MHSCLVRLQNAFGFFTTMAAVVGVAVALTSLMHEQTPSATIKLSSAQITKGRPHYYSTTKTEYARVHFDLDADLSSLFGWNTKQVFVWITATYPSTARNATVGTSMSEAVIWDKILQSRLETDPPSLWELVKRNPYDSLPGQGKKSKGKTSSKKEKGPVGVLKLRNEKPKYRIPDPSGHLAHLDNVTLTLGWNVQPWVGALAWTNSQDLGRWKALEGGRSKAFALPGVKGASDAGAGKAEKPKGGGAEPVVGN